ncbi:hypothetical protein N7532_010916 [Penicillium argentinense]|uniref:NAD-dependent epimerase/dehydratase domain-containing protein n=1 Tax=Penicillium argentinense TaxID=1131581 RepID=A0A9W9JYH4_9EURO|nr:uncharacterized protein N7532_010916 [Penicillium argentinense]KAJ5086145.1 hypothetical protein N7532_010916 [Penicillium argentinense]
MAGELIFITGATGFIGSATALAALKAGYRLRICLRKPSQKIQDLLSEYSDRIEFVIVPDIADERAFRGKLDGADYVLHLASPLTHGTNKETYFSPAVKGTIAVLKEAAEVFSIKKVVVTSSIAALIPMTGIPCDGVVKGRRLDSLHDKTVKSNPNIHFLEDNDWDFSVDEAANFDDPANPAATPMKLYHASKLLANNATWKYWETTRPHYSLVTLHPSFVYGHNLVQTSAEGVSGSSNGILWKTVMGGVAASNVTGVHIQDVADAHIKALSPKIADGSRYLISGNQTTWKEIAQIVLRDYPDVGAKIATDLEGESWPTNTTKAESELGISWRPFEHIVHEVMDQQLQFLSD